MDRATPSRCVGYMCRKYVGSQKPVLTFCLLITAAWSRSVSERCGARRELQGDAVHAVAQPEGFKKRQTITRERVAGCNARNFVGCDLQTVQNRRTLLPSPSAGGRCAAVDQHQRRGPTCPVARRPRRCYAWDRKSRGITKPPPQSAGRCRSWLASAYP